jgi:ribosomal protein S18 acetylase RimI-like enzyme
MRTRGMKTLQMAHVSLRPTRKEESEELVTLRIEAMRASLERAGRFDAQRARHRFLANFVPELTHHILLNGERVGFVVVRPTSDGLTLDHLYVRPDYQGRGIGSAVLRIVFKEADSRALPIRVGALRGSDANRFYLRHGFVHTEEREWDIYYVRPPVSRDSEEGRDTDLLASKAANDQDDAV